MFPCLCYCVYHSNMSVPLPSDCMERPSVPLPSDCMERTSVPLPSDCMERPSVALPSDWLEGNSLCWRCFLWHFCFHYSVITIQCQSSLYHFVSLFSVYTITHAGVPSTPVEVTGQMLTADQQQTWPVDMLKVLLNTSQPAAICMLLCMLI